MANGKPTHGYEIWLVGGGCEYGFGYGWEDAAKNCSARKRELHSQGIRYEGDVQFCLATTTMNIAPLLAQIAA